MTQSIEEALDDFFNLLGGISDVSLRHVNAVWQDHQADGRRIAASTHARSIIKNSRRQRLFDAAADDLRAWLNSRATAGAGVFGVSDVPRIQTAGEATRGLVDCLLAIIAADQLNPREYEILVMPVGEAVRAEKGSADAEEGRDA
jgi:hypothetical protein